VDDVIEYPVIGEPPSKVDGDHDTVACPFPGAALGKRTMSGNPAGVTGLEGALDGPVPAVLVAVTARVYEIPFVRPLIVAFVAFGGAVAESPRDDVTV
jgi:hypothetical protein